jgi:cytochrome c peroxidase
MAEPSLVFIHRLPPDPSGSPQPPPPPESPGAYHGGSIQNLAINGPRPTSIEIKDSKTGDRDVYKVVTSNLQSEWRTPPLWGLGDSPPYLHDGRAATVNDAIEWHGGEAEFSVKQYKELELTDRVSLVNFLHSLRAP